MANNLTVFFISENYVKEQSAVMDNVGDDFIRSHVLESQNIHIQNIIGTKLYDALVDDYTVTGKTFSTTAYKTLIDSYIQPCLLYYTLYESMYDLAMKFTNKSIVKQSSDNSTNVEDSMFYARRSDFKNKAEYYSQRLIDFLLNNDDVYTLYRDWVIDDEPNTIAPNKSSNYSNGLYLNDVKKDTVYKLDSSNPRFSPLN